MADSSIPIIWLEAEKGQNRMKEKFIVMFADWTEQRSFCNYFFLRHLNRSPLSVSFHSEDGLILITGLIKRKLIKDVSSNLSSSYFMKTYSAEKGAIVKSIQFSPTTFL